MTNRQAIDNFRQKLKERNADSRYTAAFLFQALEEQAKWLIRREITWIYSSNDLFQIMRNVEVEEAPLDSCSPIKTNCKVYRTKRKLPEMWSDTIGPIIKSTTSIDKSVNFTFTSPNATVVKSGDPYQKMIKEFYFYFEDGYLYFVGVNPHLVHITAFFKEDLSLFDRKCSDCEDNEDCVRFLDTKFTVPDQLIAEMYAKALQLMAPTARMIDDVQVDKDPNRKN